MKIRRNGWASFLIFFVILAMIVGIAISVAVGTMILRMGIERFGVYTELVGVTIIVFGVLLTVSAVSITMVYLTMAQDIRDIKNLLLLKHRDEEKKGESEK